MVALALFAAGAVLVAVHVSRDGILREEQRVEAADEVVERTLGELSDGASADVAAEASSALSEDKDDELLLDEGGAASFLGTLGAGQSASGVASTGWRSSQGIEEAVEAVLCSYGELDGAGLVTGGYLDLQGRAWGAIVLLDGGMVDIVLVKDGEGGSASSTRVVRLSADGLAGR